MGTMDGRGFRFGDWQVDVGGNSLSHGDASATLEPRAMDVLRYLCRHPGAVIPAEELLQTCWGTAELGDNPVHKAIAQLRRALGDSSTAPRYIETVRKRGYRAIAAVVELDDGAGQWQGGSPFRGLEAFQESHAAIFFGRVQATHRLRETVLRQVADGCPMALVLGPSGSGKTSLVRAGLLPSLVSDPVAPSCVLHMDCADLAGSDLFGALAAVLVDAECDEHRLFEGSSADALGRRLRDEPDAVAATLGTGASIRIAIFVDRLEAIFRAPATTDADRARFVGLLQILARAGTLVILACRNDFYPALIALPELMALKSRGGHFDIEPPDGADIAQMVRQPARAAQLTFEHDAATGASLDDVLCDAARASPDALPLLQYCLDELYRQRSDDGTLRFDVFRKLGGIEGALGVRAEQIVAALPAAQQAALPHVLSLLVNIGEEQNAVTARRPAWSALTHEAQRELVRALVEARLFVSELTGEVPTFGVAHEALLRRWPRVVEWVERHRQSLQIRTRVAAQAERWAAAGRPRDLLLPAGMQTNQARGLLEIADLALSQQEKDYVGASLRRAKLGSRIRIGVMSVIALLAVLAGVLGFTARSAQKEAEQRRADAEGLMSFMLGDFVDKLRPLGRLDLLDDVSAKALGYLTQSEAHLENRGRLEHKARTLQLIGELSISRSKPDSAKKALLEAKEIFETLLVATPNDRSLLKAIGENAFWQGKISMDRSDWAEATSHMRRYLTVAERVVQLAPQDPDAQLELSYALNNQGTVAMRIANFSAATLAFSRAIEIKKKLLLQQPDSETLNIDLSNSLSWQAKASAALGTLEEARLLYIQEYTLLRKLLDRNPNNSDWRSRLASSLSNRADIEQALGYDTASQALFSESTQLWEALVRSDPTNVTWKKNLTVLLYSKLQSHPQSDGSLTILNWRSLLTRIAELKAAEPSNLTLIKLMVSTHYAMAEYYFERRDIAAARTQLEAAAQAVSGTQTKVKNDLRILSKLAQARILDAEISRLEGNYSETLSKCADAKGLLLPVRNKISDLFVLSVYVRTFACSDNLSEVTLDVEHLKRMNYRETRYEKYMSLHH
ncbi:winged helix-turn-helix domain-containing protein [Pseudoduganella plicata]|uniref:Transcriptional regulator n=1 Tax=Pseudoduganella plicata TaxID=321984 RepID=A0A4V1ATG6_9BURK|nr:winged helix-turn-helix domain-containing protein [Pseudoduganella plicata]QBQ35598.1 transcriptional regulator [Pseudoduganella plicata]GGY96666.1 transcriptional regulator [Pseudoduganella plicata]